MSMITLIGPVGITWYDVTAGTDLGKTEGDVNVTFVQEYADIKYDQDGVSPVGGVITGATMEIVTPLAQASVSILQNIFSEATLTAITGQDGRFAVKGGVGTDMYAGSAVLELVRYVDGSLSSDADDYLRVLKAYPIPDFEWVYGKEGQRVTNVRWLAYPVQETADNGVYFTLGDDGS